MKHIPFSFAFFFTFP
ncbi:TPA: pheA operon leader peptide PheL [Escherichia coli]|nr:pheA operon leader peptide PheL [Escherichia coli]HBV0279047.1 pheA operon leader peptide PheL [Escherichia coli]HDD8704987.1 pheA operon leader peptide PheL [Escherichia coli]